MAVQNGAFNYQIIATNNPASYYATQLPVGLGVNTATGMISGTAVTTGTSNVVISASNAVGSGSATLTLIVEPPYTAWKNLWFTPAELSNPSVSGDAANPAGDGISNLIKYALGLNPKAHAVTGIVVDVLTGYLRMTVQKNPMATDLTFTVEVNDDLTNSAGWTNAGTVIDQNTATILQVSAGIPVNTKSRQFMRLKIARP